MIKLSQLNTDEFLDKTCELVPHLLEIAKDDEIISIFTEKVERPQGATNEEIKKLVWDIGVDKVGKATPLMLKKYRSDMFAILSTMNGKTIEEISKQHWIKTFKDVKELLNDEDLKALFLELTA